MSSLLEKRKSLTESLMRDSICAAAASVLESGGFGALTMDHVASAAGVSKGTLYNYFSDKDSLLLAAMDRAFAPLQAELEDILNRPSGACANLRDATRALLRGVEERRTLGIVLVEEGTSKAMWDDRHRRSLEVQAALTRAFAQALRDGKTRGTGVSAEDLGRMFVLILHGVIDLRLRHPEDSPDIDHDISLVETLVLNQWLEDM